MPTATEITSTAAKPTAVPIAIIAAPVAIFLTKAVISRVNNASLATFVITGNAMFRVKKTLPIVMVIVSIQKRRMSSPVRQTIIHSRCNARTTGLTAMASLPMAASITARPCTWLHAKKNSRVSPLPAKKAGLTAMVTLQTVAKSRFPEQTMPIVVNVIKHVPTARYAVQANAALPAIKLADTRFAWINV